VLDKIAVLKNMFNTTYIKVIAYIRVETEEIANMVHH